MQASDGQILTLLSRGMKQHEIAEQLVLTPRQVGARIAALRADLRAATNIQLVVNAIRAGLM